MHPVGYLLIFLAAITIYLLFTRRENLEARYYACSQVCDLQHPDLLVTCIGRGGVKRAMSGNVKSSPECNEYYKCVKGCREKQEEEIARDPTFGQGSPYVHLDQLI